MINLILFGPPGSGKGTQAIKLADKYGLVHISTGDLFRYEMSNDTELGQLAKSYMSAGELVPDEVTISMLLAKMSRHPEAHGFIFDGFPRTIPQADALIRLLGQKDQSINALIALNVNDEEIVNRIKLRGMDSGRTDDMDESIIRNRIKVYKDETQPVYEYFGNLQKAHEVDGQGTVDEIFQLLVNEIEKNI